MQSFFRSHFFYAYKDSKGASRLPVLALYAVYTVLTKELHRYGNKQLKPLEAIVDSAKQKIRSSRVDRYYILTTSQHHEPTSEVLVEAENVKRLLGTQMIVNGVIPTIRYYLRLLSDPSSVLPEYVRLLQIDGAISFEHKDIWNKIATGIIE